MFTYTFALPRMEFLLGGNERGRKTRSITGTLDQFRDRVSNLSAANGSWQRRESKDSVSLSAG